MPISYEDINALTENNQVLNFICEHGVQKLTDTLLSKFADCSSSVSDKIYNDPKFKSLCEKLIIGSYLKLAGRVSNQFERYFALKSYQERFDSEVIFYAKQREMDPFFIELDKNSTLFFKNLSRNNPGHFSYLNKIYNGMASDNRSSIQLFIESAAGNSSSHEQSLITACTKSSVTSGKCPEARLPYTSESISLNLTDSCNYTLTTPSLSTMQATNPMLATHSTTTSQQANLSSLKPNFSASSASTLLDNTTSATSTSPSTSLTNSTEIVKLEKGSTGDFHINGLLISFGLGALAGSLDGLSETLLHILERKSCSANTIRLVAVVLAVSNSLAIATLPFIYSVIQQLDNDRDPSIQSEAVIRLTFGFLTALVLQSIKVGIHHFSNRLDNKPMLKSLIGFLPLLACLWMIANGGDSVVEGLALAGMSLAGAIVSKSIVSCANKFIFFPVKRKENVRPYNRNSTIDESITSLSIAQGEQHAVKYGLQKHRTFASITENSKKTANVVQFYSQESTPQPLLSAAKEVTIASSHLLNKIIVPMEFDKLIKELKKNVADLNKDGEQLQESNQPLLRK